MRLVPALLIWFALSSLEARRLPIKTYTTADGLARDRVQCIVQDHRGFLWFCTAEGLSRFDGYHFTNYGTEHGLPRSNVTSMVETSEGVFWVGTPAGLCRFDPAAQGAAQFRPYQLPGSVYAQEINTLFRDADGSIWAGTYGGLFRLRKSAAAFERVDLDPAARWCSSTWVASCGSLGISTLIEDRRRRLWAGTLAGLFEREPNGRTKHFTSGPYAPKAGPGTMLEDRDGMMWFDGARWRLDESSAPVEKLTELSIPGHALFSVLQASTGKIWFGTSRGLAEWIPGATGTSRVFEFYDMNNGMIGREADVLAEDRDGNLWIGTDGGGVIKMAASGIVSYYAQDGLEGRTDTGSLFETREGDLCFLEQAAIARFDGVRFVRTRPGWPAGIDYFGWGTNRLALQDRTGDWWLATGKGLVRFPPVTFDRLASQRPKAVYGVADGLPSDNIFQIFADSRDDIWISALNGVARFERKTGRIHAFSKEYNIDSAPTGFAEDRAGNIWIGSYHGFLARYQDGRFRFFTNAQDAPGYVSNRQGVPGGGWKVPYVDSAGRLWVGARRGLGRSDNPTAAEPGFVTYTTAQGLASSDVKSLAEDRWGNLYAATGRGVDRIRATADGIVVTRHYTYADGLAAGELASAYRDRNGSLWFVTTLGISQLTPAPDRPPTTPPVLVTGLQIGTAVHPIGEAGQSEIRGLTVKPGNGPLRIDFVGLSFAPGETLRYQYQLAGVDRDWSVPADQRSVVYGRLAAGSYRFLVRAVTSEGVTSPLPASVVFTMLPPFWQRWWFVAAAALATAAAVYAAHGYRVRQLLAVDRMRTRIATDLHDDIGSSLSHISILSGLARQRLNTADPAVSQYLAEISTVSGEMVASLSDIVWAINPRHDRLSDLSARMRRFAVDVLGARGIDLQFHADGHQERLRTNSDFRREVYLIFKEAVNNSARHAGSTRASVDLRVENGRLALHVRDNGAGFEPSSTADGNGLENMRRRAASLGGELAVRSSPGHGTEVELTLPLPQA